MKLTKFVILIIALCLCFSQAREETNDEAITKNFFLGRSADIILKSQQYLPIDKSLLVRLDGKTSVSDPITDVDVAYSLWAPSHGVEVSDEGKVPLLDGHDLFAKTKLNLLFTVDSIGKETLSEFPSLAMLNGEQRTLKQSGYGEDSLAMLTSMISGREPKSHGIVCRKWKSASGHSVSAFKSPSTMSLVPNYPDLLSKLFIGRSIVFGASADFQIASALTAHPALYADHPFWNDYGFYFDEALDSFESLYPFAVFEPQLMLSKAKLVSKLELKFPLGINSKTDQDLIVRFDNSRMNVDISSKDLYVSFSAEQKEEFRLIAEIRFILTALDMFSEQENWAKLVEDESPDYIAFGFSSLQKILEINGKQSSKFRAALFVVDCIVRHAKDKFSEMYLDSVHTHVAFIQPQIVDFDPQVVSKVDQVLKETSSSNVVNIEADFPSVYLKKGVDVEQVCDRLRSVLSEESVQVFCPSVNLNDQQNQQQMNDAAPSVDSASHPSSSYEDSVDDEYKPYEFVFESMGDVASNHTITWDDVLVFHLMFWFTIAIILAILCGSCAVFVIDIPRNVNLIRNLPNIHHDPHQQRNLW